MSDAMHKALGILRDEGVIFAGVNVVDGKRVLIARRTIDALERLAFVQTFVSPDGVVAARIDLK
jgi:hypothetical protein